MSYILGPPVFCEGCGEQMCTPGGTPTDDCESCGLVEGRVKPPMDTWCNCQAIPGTANYPGPWHERGGESHYPCAQAAA